MDYFWIVLYVLVFEGFVFVYPPIFFIFIFFKYSTFMNWKPVERWLAYLSGMLPLFIFWSPIILPPGVWPFESDMYLPSALLLPMHYSLFYLFAILSVIKIKTRVFSILPSRELRFFWLLLAMMIWIGLIVPEIELSLTAVH